LFFSIFNNNLTIRGYGNNWVIVFCEIKQKNKKAVYGKF